MVQISPGLHTPGFTSVPTEMLISHQHSFKESWLIGNVASDFCEGEKLPVTVFEAFHHLLRFDGK